MQYYLQHGKEKIFKLNGNRSYTGMNKVSYKGGTQGKNSVWLRVTGGIFTKAKLSKAEIHGCVNIIQEINSWRQMKKAEEGQEKGFVELIVQKPDSISR